MEIYRLRNYIFKYPVVVLMPLVLLFALHLPRTLVCIFPSTQHSMAVVVKGHVKHTMSPCPDHPPLTSIPPTGDLTFSTSGLQTHQYSNWMAGAMAFVPLPAGIVLQASRRPECRLDREKGHTNGKIRNRWKTCGAEAERQ